MVEYIGNIAQNLGIVLKAAPAVIRGGAAEIKGFQVRHIVNKVYVPQRNRIGPNGVAGQGFQTGKAGKGTDFIQVAAMDGQMLQAAHAV